MKVKLFDSELKVMETLWREGDLTAGQIAKILNQEIGWNRNTTYTVIKKCIEKGAIERMFDGSKQKFFAALLSDESMDAEELKQLKDMLDQMQ